MMLKKQLINYNFILKIIFIFFLVFSSSFADIIKPNVNIEPNEVVKIQFYFELVVLLLYLDIKL